MELNLQYFGGRGSGGGKSSGGAGGGIKPEGLSQSLEQYQRRAISSADVDNLARGLDKGFNRGDSISARENNRNYIIEDTYVKRPTGDWQYTRTNRSNGDVYENRRVSSNTVASDILSTATSNEPMNWKGKKR